MRYFTVRFKRWWFWFSPKAWQQRKVLQAFIDANQEVIKMKMEEEYRNLLLYGCSIAPDEFYGKSIVDEVMEDLEKKQREKRDGMEGFD